MGEGTYSSSSSATSGNKIGPVTFGPVTFGNSGGSATTPVATASTAGGLLSFPLIALVAVAAALFYFMRKK